MREPLNSDETADLRQLWRRRGCLDGDEMARMYDIVQRALRECNPPELHALGESKEEMVAQFIFVKVLYLNADPESGNSKNSRKREDDGHSAPSSSFALCAYFKRYLIDCTRNAEFRRTVSMGDNSSEDYFDVIEEESDGIETHLAEFGLSLGSVSAAAHEFIAQLGDPERLLLCEGFGNETAGGLAGVASRHCIASYHYRAGRLDLVHKREAMPSDYEKTLLGQWIRGSLGIPIVPENMKSILAVFKILGAVASYR